MVKGLVLAAWLWPSLLAVAVDRHAHGAAVWPAYVYLASAHICHQNPGRSFSVSGKRWPVCARCLGLYAVAPIGASLAAGRGRRRRPHPARPRVRLLLLASLPTLMTLAIELGGVHALTNLVRFSAALPLGAALAFVLVEVARRPSRPIG